MFTDAELLILPDSLREKIELASRETKEALEKAARLEKSLSEAGVLVATLREALRLARAKTYGRASETLTDAQLRFLDGEPFVTEAEVKTEAALPDAEKAAVEGKRRRPRLTRRLPAELPRTEILVPVEEKCERCGEDRPLLGYEISEKLDFIPARHQVLVYKREKRGPCKNSACEGCEGCGMTTAPMPPQIIPKGIGSNRLVISVIIAKFWLHVPLYRQETRIHTHLGVLLSRQTMCGWVMTCGFLLQAIRSVMMRDLVQGDYIQADETPIDVRSRTPGKNHRGYMWVYGRPNGPVVYDYRDGRGRDGPETMLRDFRGTLQTDEWHAYQSPRLNIRAMACLAHARRKFHDALQMDPKNRGLLSIIALMGEIYAVESEAKEQKATPERRLEMRQERSVKLMSTLRAEIVTLHNESLPQSLAGKACAYALKLWEKLEIFLTDGRLEIDNNACENAIRPIALGRKNWLHLGSSEAGANIAAVMSVIETCRRLGINPSEYLEDVLPRLANGNASIAETLTPMAWNAARTAAAK